MINEQINKAVLKRFRVRVDKCIARERAKHGADFFLQRLETIQLMSLWDRMWLLFVAIILLLPLYWIVKNSPEDWWIFVILAIPAFFFLWKSVVGVQLKLGNPFDGCISDDELAGKLIEIAKTRNAGLVAIDVLLMVLIAVLEVTITILGVIAAVLAGLTGG